MQEFNLKSNVVLLQCVRFLVDYQENKLLKLQRNLTKANINPTQYQKMRVNLAMNVFSSDTISALKFLKNEYPNSDELLSTIAFFEYIVKWFKLISSKDDEHILSEYEFLSANKEFMKKFIKLFKKITYATKDKWRPIQTGFILNTESFLNLYKYLNHYYDTKELIMRRLTTDSIENLFSQIRSSGQSHPNSVDVKYALKRISFAKHIDISKSWNYNQDDSTFFTSIDSLKKYQNEKLYKTTIVCEDMDIYDVNLDL